MIGFGGGWVWVDESFLGFFIEKIFWFLWIFFFTEWWFSMVLWRFDKFTSTHLIQIFRISSITRRICSRQFFINFYRLLRHKLRISLLRRNLFKRLQGILPLVESSCRLQINRKLWRIIRLIFIIGIWLTGIVNLRPHGTVTIVVNSFSLFYVLN